MGLKTHMFENKSANLQTMSTSVRPGTIMELFTALDAALAAEGIVYTQVIELSGITAILLQNWIETEAELKNLELECITPVPEQVKKILPKEIKLVPDYCVLDDYKERCMPIKSNWEHLKVYTLSTLDIVAGLISLQGPAGIAQRGIYGLVNLKLLREEFEHHYCGEHLREDLVKLDSIESANSESWKFINTKSQELVPVEVNSGEEEQLLDSKLIRTVLLAELLRFSQSDEMYINTCKAALSLFDVSIRDTLVSEGNQTYVGSAVCTVIYYLDRYGINPDSRLGIALLNSVNQLPVFDKSLIKWADDSKTNFMLIADAWKDCGVPYTV